MRYFENIQIVDEKGRVVLSFKRDIPDGSVVIVPPDFVGSMRDLEREVPVEPIKKAVVSDRVRGCGMCGAEGHNRQTCPNKSAVLAGTFKKTTQMPHELVKEGKAVTLESVQRVLPPRAQEEPKESASKLRGERLLTLQEFKKVKKYRQEHWSKTPIDIANELDVPLQQVNFIILSVTYDGYVRTYNRP